MTQLDLNGHDKNAGRHTPLFPITHARTAFQEIGYKLYNNNKRLDGSVIWLISRDEATPCVGYAYRNPRGLISELRGDIAFRFYEENRAIREVAERFGDVNVEPYK